MDPSLDLQKAVVQHLRASPELQAFLGTLPVTRVFDKVPPETPFPYISYGSDDILEDDADCLTAYEIAMQLDIWSRDEGQVEMKQISGVVRKALHNTELTLDNHRLVILEHEQTRYLEDPDGITHHGALTFRALVDE